MTGKEFIEQLDKKIKNLATKDDLNGIKSDIRDIKDDARGTKSDIRDIRNDVQGVKDDILSLKLDIGELKEEVRANTEITQETRVVVDEALKYAKDAKDETVVLGGRVEKLESI